MNRATELTLICFFFVFSCWTQWTLKKSISDILKILWRPSWIFSWPIFFQNFKFQTFFMREKNVLSNGTLNMEIVEWDQKLWFLKHFLTTWAHCADTVYIWVTKPQGLVRRSSLWLLFYFRCIYFLSSLLYLHCLYLKYTSVKKQRFCTLKFRHIGR